VRNTSGEKYAKITYLFLRQITVQLLTRQAKETKYNAELMGELLASQEDEDTGLETASAEGRKKGRSVGLPTCSDAHKLLHQATGNAPLWVDEKPHRFVEGHLDEFIDRVCHGCGKEHGLTGNRAGFDDFS
jgi:hypothetical protein